MILIFDLFQTLVEDIHMDFNLGLKPLWETYYRDKCSFDEIKAWINRYNASDVNGFATYQIKDITELRKKHIV